MIYDEISTIKVRVLVDLALRSYLQIFPRLLYQGSDYRVHHDSEEPLKLIVRSLNGFINKSILFSCFKD